VSTAAVSTLPLTGESEGWGLVPDDPDSRQVTFRVRAITPAYFRTIGIRLRAGREFAAVESPKNPVVILSESAARQRWPGIRDPLGRKLQKMTLVGIVDDTRASGMDNEIEPYLYTPFLQFAPEEFAVAVRADRDAVRLASAVKSEIWRLDRDLPVTHVSRMRQLVADSIAPRRFEALLMSLFAGFALLLAAVGIYGVVAYSVAQRTQEFGIRLALGATREDIIASVVRRAVALSMAGAVAGLAAAFALIPLLRGLLYGVSALDPSIFALSALLLGAVAAAAGWVPARRAARVDPVVSLRYE
jgi:putative ABC transport system permease protein